MLLKDKTAIVTGAGQGLGRGIALALAENGAAVAIIDRNAETAQRTHTDLVESGARSLAVVSDVSQRDQVDDAVARIVAEFGGVDILVNNAQVAKAHQVPFEEHSDDDMELPYRTGVLGTIYCMQACFAHMKERGGAIVNFGSAAGVEGQLGMLAYAATKEGIRGITRVAAHEWGQFGIRVNTVLPFGMSEAAHRYAAAQPEVFAAQIEKVPLRRTGDPQADVGNAVVALASDLMAWVTGCTIGVDGGMCIYS